MKRLASYLLIGVVVLSGGQLWAGNRARTVVMPALYPMVQLGADISILTGATLLTYEPVPVATGAFPLVHRFVPRTLSWERVSGEVYSFGHYSPVQSIDEIIVVGPEAMVPTALFEMAPAPRIRRIASIQPAAVANELHQTMDFSRSQWRTLAKRHHFEIEDRNEERRRYGRYGRYGADAAAPEPVIEPVVLEVVSPVQIDEESFVAPVEVVTVTSDPVAIVEIGVVEPEVKGGAVAVVEAVPVEVEVAEVEVAEVEVVEVAEVEIPEVEVVAEPVPEVVPVVKGIAVDERPTPVSSMPQEKGADPVPQLSPIEASQGDRVPALAPAEKQ